MSIWTTREGIEIPFVLITDEHLLNILWFLRRRAIERMTMEPCEYSGDEIVEAIEREETLGYAEHWTEYAHPHYPQMLMLAKSRQHFIIPAELDVLEYFDELHWTDWQTAAPLKSLCEYRHDLIERTGKDY